MQPKDPREELVEAVTGRPGWTMADGEAVFTPVGAGWVVKVRPLPVVERRNRYHVVAVRTGGFAAYTNQCSSAAHAVDVAEQVQLG